MTHERNHINPSLIIKRFKTTKDYIIKNFPESRTKGQTPAEESILRIEKYKLIEKNKLISDDFEYTNSSSDLFIKDKIYFINQTLLNALIIKSKENNDIKLLEYLNKIEPKSLEKSYNSYEAKMSNLLDKKMKENFKNITTDERYDIRKFFESSYLRPIKYRNLKNYITSSEDTIRKITSFIANFKNKKFDLDNLNIPEMIIFFEIFMDFFKKQIDVNIDITDLEMFNLMNFFAYVHNEDMKKEDTNQKLSKENIFFCKSENLNFILGDNPVYTIYKGDNTSVIDEINKLLKKEKLIKRDLIKISIMVVSPNNVILITPNEININKISITIQDDFVKIINAITLFNTDEWIVMHKMIGNKKEFINLEILSNLEIYNFFENKSQKLLLDLNYEIGIDNKYNKINKLFLNEFISFIYESNEKLYEDYKKTKKDLYQNEDFKMISYKGQKCIEIEYHIIKKEITEKINIIKDLDQELMLYVIMTIKEKITQQIKAERSYSIYLVVGDLNDIDNCIFTDMFQLDRNINYDYIMLKLT